MAKQSLSILNFLCITIIPNFFNALIHAVCCFLGHQQNIALTVKYGRAVNSKKTAKTMVNTKTAKTKDFMKSKYRWRYICKQFVQRCLYYCSATAYTNTYLCTYLTVTSYASGIHFETDILPEFFFHYCFPIDISETYSFCIFYCISIHFLTYLLSVVKTVVSVWDLKFNVNITYYQYSLVFISITVIVFNRFCKMKQKTKM